MRRQSSELKIDWQQKIGGLLFGAQSRSVGNQFLRGATPGTSCSPDL
jgi:hypothetical protein